VAGAREAIEHVLYAKVAESEALPRGLDDVDFS
jgi:hypothetical protein